MGYAVGFIHERVCWQTPVFFVFSHLHLAGRLMASMTILAEFVMAHIYRASQNFSKQVLVNSWQNQKTKCQLKEVAFVKIIENM